MRLRRLACVVCQETEQLRSLIGCLSFSDKFLTAVMRTNTQGVIAPGLKSPTLSTTICISFRLLVQEFDRHKAAQAKVGWAGLGWAGPGLGWPVMGGDVKRK